MATPFNFPSTTARLNLPLLFAGQAQKEFFVNQSLELIDALMQPVITASLAAPPADPAPGSIYRITATANGEWAGKEDDLAVRIGGAWNYVTPYAGMTAVDAQSGAILCFDSGWQAPHEPPQATGGSVIDTEARQMLTELVDALRTAGIFASS
ncbi:DUF2793 domain-containing protein [Qipengyuania nanhaisediminis]|uniref:DUF2793 domain-containing protein n=1 Tax=Qipengyuania nanhaisediminis TaxID=604088 RepID=UPI0038B31B62